MSEKPRPKEGMAAMAKYDELANAVTEYSDRYRRSDLPKLMIGLAYDLYPQEGKPALECQHCWPETWPNSDKAGIYAFLDRDLNVVYIGKSSMNSFLGARLSAYCGYDENRNCRLHHSGWTASPRYVWTVGVPDELSFEAPALEEYLIKKLKPTDNVAGK